jgi:hypothetical protein
VLHCLKRFSLAPVIAIAIVALGAGTAMALTITGTDGHDRIVGSRQADTIDAKGGASPATTSLTSATAPIAPSPAPATMASPVVTATTS